MSEKYGAREGIKSVLHIGSASGHTGAEFPEYCASKGGVIAYTKNVALRVAPYGAVCNSLDPGGVLTPLNDCVVTDPALWEHSVFEARRTLYVSRLEERRFPLQIPLALLRI